MPVVYAAAVSHAPGIRAWAEKAPRHQFEAISSAFEVVRQRLHAAEPDILILLTSEHWANYFLDHISAFCVGRGDTFIGPIEPWLKVEKLHLLGDPTFATHLLKHCYDNDFELGYSHEMKLDHGSMIPLSYLALKPNVKLVPIMFNTLATPRPNARRCLALGRLIGELLARSPERIAVIATGGLSHDPGEKNHGAIDEAFDREFLSDLAGARLDRLAAYSDERMLAAGAGTLELLAWVCLAGIMGEAPATILGYEAVEPWATGVGVVTYA